MAYGFNDGDQRRQSVRLAGRATPTPGSSSSSTAASPQYPSSSQRQPRPTPRQNTSGSETRGQASTAATRRRDGAVASSRSNAKTERRSRSTDQRQSTRSFTGTRQRQTDVPQLRRNGRPQPGIFVRRSFSRPQNGRSGLSSRPASRAGSGAPALPFRRARIALCSIVACLLFLFLGSCISHGSAGLEPTAEDKLLKAPVAPGYSFAFSTPRSQWQAGTMPHIYQIDPAWSELPYAGGTIRQNACGPTCLTMVYIFKTGRTDMTPVDMCALSEAGNYAPTGATEWSFMTSGAWQLGLNGTELHNDRDSMTQALRSGAPVIAAVRPGTFTNVGHYIVLYGIDDADQIEVFDPNSASRSARRWGVVEVLNEVEAMWAYY
ncbi:Peptidase_C39 like family protein [Collinsella aerofaciens]|uniref:Peptidase_C39 like family protein n=1 Tax=Collinsella aerofaciens TaxID=74426 RepID=A0A5K1IIU5_9ACTN|nr:Peptidase_C39 like family protein [Collinsella aerofaciens]